MQRGQRVRVARQPYGSECRLCEWTCGDTENEVVKKRKKKKKREFAETTLWKKYERRLDGLINKAVGFKFVLDTYAYDDDKCSSGRRVRPEAEVISTRQKYLETKNEIRRVLQEIDSIDNDARWGVPGTEDDDSIEVDHVSCSKCGGMTADDDNDIVLCDRKNCYRAYHMKCCDPVLDKEQLGDPEDDWFCHLCETMEQAIKKINELFDKNYSDPDLWTQVFLDDKEIEVATPKLHKDSILGIDLDKESDDSDFASSSSSQEHSSSASSQNDDDDSFDSIASGDDPYKLEQQALSDKRIVVEDVHEKNIISQPRKRSRVDYLVLNDALFCPDDDGALEESSSEDGNWSSS